MSRVVDLDARRAAAPAVDIAALARAAYERGEFDVCDAYLTAARPASRAQRGELALVRAKLERSRSNVESWADAAAVAEREHPEPAGRMAGAALGAAAARRAGEDARADAAFAQLGERVAGAPEGVYATYLLAVDAWERFDEERAAALVRPYATGMQADPACISLLGWIAVRRGRFAEAGNHYVRALEQCRRSAELNNYSYVNAVTQLCIVSSETANLRLGRRARRAYEHATWGPSFEYLRFCALAALRHLALLAGDRDAAWLYARDAAGVVKKRAALAIMNDIDGAVSSRLVGDDRARGLLLERAWKAIRARRWGDAGEQDRLALAEFAAEAAREMPTEARQALTLYQSLRAKAMPQDVLDRDARVEAFMALAVGRVEEAGGARAVAIEAYRHALSRYEALGLNFRIAIVANDLWRVTRDPAYRDRMRQALVGAPKAWLLSDGSSGPPPPGTV